ncbi:class I adenylate-forming enzyme family protein [Paenibacillus polymyxa]
MDLVRLVDQILDTLNSNEFTIADNEHKGISGKELSPQVSWLASKISELPSGPIGICCSNGPRLIIALLAVMLSERSIILLGVKWQDSELNHVINESPCAAVIFEAGFREIDLGEGWHTFIASELAVQYRTTVIPFVPDGLWVGQYTSGTTGRSKLVIREWQALQDEIMALDKAVLLSGNPLFLNMAPAHHSYGFCGGMLWPLYKHAKIVTIRDFYPSQTRKIWHKKEPDVVFGLPFQYQFIATSPGPVPNKPVIAFSAGGPLVREVREVVHENLGFYLSNNYGSTESGTMCIYPEMPIDEKVSCVGWPLQGRVFATDVNGQLLLESEGVMRGYYGEEPVSLPYKTGDKGIISDDGRVFIQGRIKPVINIGGVKVDTSYVEEVLLRIPAISEVVVFPDESTGFYQSIKAFVVLKENSMENEASIREHCRDYLKQIEVPRKIIIVDQLPRSETGKILGKYLLNIK